MSNNNRYVRLSKTMSVALRHDPDSFGIELDEEGWVDVDKLLDALRKHKRWEGITEEDFHTVMSVSDKKRFEISDGHIRALYGHSIPMKIVKEPTTPPPLLYHGTARRNLDTILQQGILPMSPVCAHVRRCGNGNESGASKSAGHCDPSNKHAGRTGGAVLLWQ